MPRRRFRVGDTHEGCARTPEGPLPQPEARCGRMQAPAHGATHRPPKGGGDAGPSVGATVEASVGAAKGHETLATAGAAAGNREHMRDPLAGTGWLEAVPLLGDGAHLEVFSRAEALRRKGRVVYPPSGQVFAALRATPWDRVRVVVLGQDPYHGEGQAHGLAFSVPEGVPAPRSLRNVFREIETDLGHASDEGKKRHADALPEKTAAGHDGGGLRPPSTDLTRWARQGVLLLNTVLTVEAGQAHSHARLGWQEVTAAVVEALGRCPRPMAFLLWGRHAAAYGEGLAAHHLVLHAAHPSPLSASRGFFGCRHFSQVNTWLRARGLDPIEW